MREEGRWREEETKRRGVMRKTRGNLSKEEEKKIKDEGDVNRKGDKGGNITEK